MNKKIFTLMSTLFLVTTNSYCHKKKSHYNDLFFSDYIKNPIVMQVQSHCISKNQPYHNPDKIVSTPDTFQDVDYDGNPINPEYQVITIVAGRHGSGKTVSCLEKKGFKDKNFTFGEVPHKLNFAVIGTLTIDGVSFDDMVLAQGHTFFSNNWWFGGKHCKSLNSGAYYIDAVNCIARDRKTTWCFLRGRINAYVNGVYVDSIPPNEVRVLNEKCNIDDD